MPRWHGRFPAQAVDQTDARRARGTPKAALPVGPTGFRKRAVGPYPARGVMMGSTSPDSIALTFAGLSVSYEPCVGAGDVSAMHPDRELLGVGGDYLVHVERTLQRWRHPANRHS